MKKTYISVCMCTCNGERFVTEQMDSIARQSLLPDELIICDDRSSDNTKQKLNSAVGKYPFKVKVFDNKKRLGVTKNFEKAIGLCSGEIIALSDQDDVWYPDKLRKIENKFREFPGTGVVFSDADIVDDRLHSLGYRLWESNCFNRREQKCLMKGNPYRVMLRHYIVAGATMAFKADFKNLVLPIPDIWFHDAWIASLISAVSKVSIVQEPLIKYRQHDHQQIGGKKKALSKRMRISSSTKTEDYLFLSRLYLILYGRLKDSKIPLINDKIMPLVIDKIRHTNARAEIHSQKRRKKRIPEALNEMINLRYHTYSQGFTSLLKDIIM